MSAPSLPALLQLQQQSYITALMVRSLMAAEQQRNAMQIKPAWHPLACSGIQGIPFGFASLK